MAKITPKTDGPLIVQGIPNLKTANGEIDPGKPVYGLCRCGQSQNKPFCDGSHTAAGFTSDKGDAKIRNTPISYEGEVEGQNVVISYTPVFVRTYRGGRRGLSIRRVAYRYRWGSRTPFGQ